MELVKSGLNIESFLLLRSIYTEHCILVFKQVVLIARAVLTPSGLNRAALL